MWRWVGLGLILLGVFLARNDIIAWVNQPGRSATGEINRAGELRASDLRVGDCFDHAGGSASEIWTALAKPCSEPHVFEVFHTGELPAGDYPTDTAFGAFAEAECRPAFATYVGLEYDRSELDVQWFVPAEELWPEDRSVQCSVFDPVDSRRTGSLRGAAR